LHMLRHLSLMLTEVRPGGKGYSARIFDQMSLSCLYLRSPCARVGRGGVRRRWIGADDALARRGTGEGRCLGGRTEGHTSLMKPSSTAEKGCRFCCAFF